MVLSNDIGLEYVKELLKQGLIGKFKHHLHKSSSVLAWCEKVGWKTLLGYMHVVHVLLKGWVCLGFPTLEDLEKILGKSWIQGTSSLVLKRWHLAFDSRTKPFTVQHLRDLLPGFPLESWNS